MKPAGQTPKRHQSGETDQQLRISKAGNKQLRSLLVQCAQYLLGVLDQTATQTMGHPNVRARGNNGKKRAIVAVAWKLAVLLHRLWTTGEIYDPLHNATALCSAA
jgi:transposase